MKIAIVGKGGSGKTTITASFIEYLKKENKSFLAFDADINMHLKLLLNIPHSKDKILSKQDNIEKIRTYLKGNNLKIISPNHMVKTTPPANGSNFICINDNNYFLKNFGTKIAKNQFFFEVGTYEKETIGTSCYHTNLSILENILSHTFLSKNEYVCVDMVAGTDAFSNTFHLLFDVIIFVLEATPESLLVYKKYLELAKHAGIEKKIYLVLNKCEDGDLEFLQDNNIKVDFMIPSSKEIRRYSQKNYLLNQNYIQRIGDEKDNNLSKNKKEQDNLMPEILLINIEKVFNKIKDKTQNEDEFFKKLYDLHLKYSSQDYILSTLGDLSQQIDKDFKYKEIVNKK